MEQNYRNRKHWMGIKSWITAGWLLMAGVSVAFGQPITVRISPSMPASTITNTVGNAPPGARIIFGPGNYIIPTNRTSWMKPGVTNRYHFEDATMYFGHASDNTGSTLAPVPIFSDQGVESHLFVTGNGTFITSNKFSPVLFVSNANSRVSFHADDLIRYNTNQATVIYQKNGRIEVVVDEIINIGYDGYWCDNAVGEGMVFLRANKILAADTAIEYPLGPTNIENANIEIGIAEHYAQGYYGVVPGNAFMEIGPNARVKCGSILLHTNSYILITGNGEVYVPGFPEYPATFPATIDAQFISSDYGTIRPTIAALQGGGRIMNALIVGGGAQDPIYIENPSDVNVLRLDNVEIWASELATNSIRSVGTNIIAGSYSFNLPMDAELLTAGTYSTTNALAVALTADNQQVSAAGAGTITLSSDNATAGNRTFRLIRGTRKQVIRLVWSGTNAGELVDDSAIGGAVGNHRLSATWTPTQHDTIAMEFNGTDWSEISRSTN